MAKPLPDDVLAYFRKEGAKGGKIGGKKSLQTMTAAAPPAPPRKAAKAAAAPRKPNPPTPPPRPPARDPDGDPSRGSRRGMGPNAVSCMGPDEEFADMLPGVSLDGA